MTRPRIDREIEVVTRMIRHYCQAKHQNHGNLCQECLTLRNYAEKRLKSCTFQEGKTTCGKCSIHCYSPAKRDNIREVMAYVGPRMILINPVMAIRHAIDGLKQKPTAKTKEKKCLE